MGQELVDIRKERADGYGIRLREKAYLTALLKNDGKLIPAYEEAFPSEAAKVEDGAKLKRAKAILKRTWVQEYMRKMLESKEVSPEWIVGSVVEIARRSNADKDKLRALEILAKITKLIGGAEGSSTKNTINLNISEDTAVRLLARRERYETGGRGDFIDVKGGDEPEGVIGDIVDGEENAG